MKDAGIAIRHSRGRILFYPAGSGTGLEGVVALWDNKLTLRKRHFFVIEKYIEDVKQEEKDVPDLLESIMRPTDPAKEELWRILFKINRFRPKITKIQKVQSPKMGLPIIPRPFWSGPHPFPSGLTLFLRYLAALAAKYLKKCGFGPLGGWLP